MKDHRTEQIEGLREIADAMEANPEMPLPYSSGYVFAAHHLRDGESDLEAMRRLAKTIPGKLEKSSDDSYFYLTRKFGAIQVQLCAARDEVCVKKQVGTKTVKKIEAVETREVEVEEPVYEWDCEPILAKAAA